MKRLVTIAALGLCFGCQETEPINNTMASAVSRDDGSWSIRTYHGHSYIKVLHVYGGRSASIVHDPDCKCGWAVGPSPRAKEDK